MGLPWLLGVPGEADSARGAGRAERGCDGRAESEFAKGDDDVDEGEESGGGAEGAKKQNRTCPPELISIRSPPPPAKEHEHQRHRAFDALLHEWQAA